MPYPCTLSNPLKLPLKSYERRKGHGSKRSHFIYRLTAPRISIDTLEPRGRGPQGREDLVGFRRPPPGGSLTVFRKFPGVPFPQPPLSLL